MTASRCYREGHASGKPAARGRPSLVKKAGSLSIFTDAQLGGLVMSIAVANLWNRLNAATRQVSGDWVEKHLA